MPPLAADLFDYFLPPHLIAQTPVARRDQSRLLVVDRAAHTIEHCTFADLPRFLHSGDRLFRNNASVLPARLHARRPTGGQVECFLLRPTDDDRTWRCLVKPGRKLPVGATFAGGNDVFTGVIIAREPDGSAIVRFTTPRDQRITEIANRIGDVPLPPYISRRGDGPDHEVERARDLERYQTVYADPARQVAVAAPTAGLHFTPGLLAALEDRGITFADITLHVGLGTFRPITTETIEAHVIHREIYEIPVATQRALLSPRGGRRIAVGTTTVRAIEDFLAAPNDLESRESGYIAEASIFIHPPRTFHGVDALITNFHQPRSTLLCLVAAFLAPGSTEGIAWLHDIYAAAIEREYRFFSYGDAMLIV
ncbi:MAG: tRNA preQ1(34) S-adenosylmethionine ribosyltransferase-isomerase QueA [Opitutaceae bacterium]